MRSIAPRSIRIVLPSLLLLASCKDTITVPVRTCVLSGTTLGNTTQTKRDTEIQDLYKTMNDTIWNAADISFLGCCQDIPVVDDPDTAVGPAGTVSLSPGGQFGTEMGTAVSACVDAWASKPSGGFTQGPVVVLVTDITSQGELINQRGVTDRRPSNKDLCVAPRALVAADVEPRPAFVIEPAGFGTGGNIKHGSTLHTLAHELGHTLLLSHGDGVDNDGNGAQPPVAGPRRFDTDCDTAERGFDEAGSLMTAEGEASTTLTKLQIELAREAAAAWPGHVGP